MADSISEKTKSFSTLSPPDNPLYNLTFTFQFEPDAPEFIESGKTSTFEVIYLQSSEIQFLHNQKSVWFYQLLKMSIGVLAIIVMGLMGYFVSTTWLTISNSLVEINVDKEIFPANKAEVAAFQSTDYSTKPQVLKASVLSRNAKKPVNEVKPINKAENKTKLINAPVKEEIYKTQLEKTSPFDSGEKLDQSLTSEPIDELAQAQIKATSEGKYVIVKFGADWCIPCKLMDDTVMKDNRVREFFRTSHIYVSMNIDHFDAHIYKRKYNIRELPTLLIFNSRGKLMKRQNGAIGSSKLIDLLETNKPKVSQR